MKKLLTCLVLLSLSLGTSRASQRLVRVLARTVPAGTFQLTGKVVTPNSEPAADAVVELYQSPIGETAMWSEAELKQRVVTDSNGGFKAELSGSEVLALVRKPEFAPSWVTLFNVNGNVEQQIVLSYPTNLVGVVVNESEKPVGEAEVWVWYGLVDVPRSQGGSQASWLPPSLARQLFSTRTSADGRFQISRFPSNGSAFLTARTQGRAFHFPDGPDTGPNTAWKPGKEIRLVVEPAGNLQGRVVADSGDSIPGAKLSLQREQSGFNPKEIEETKPDGSFRFQDISPGKYQLTTSFGANRSAEWVAELVPVSIEAGQTTRDVKVTATHGGMLEVAVYDEERKPVAGASINAFRPPHAASALSDAAGLARLRLPAGNYQVSAYKEQRRTENTAATVETARTNRVELQFSPRPKIAGTVRDPAGRPVAGIKLSIFPNWGPMSDARATTEADGRFQLDWDPRNIGSPNTSFILIAVDRDKNLAASDEIDETTREKDLQLEPSLIITGQVEDTDHHPLTNATISLTLWAGNMGSNFGEQPSTDSTGRFRGQGFPAGRRYGVSASANGYGTSSQSLPEPEGETNLVEVPAFTLKLADRDLAGQILDESEKPAANANVYIQGDNQPSARLSTDEHGRFKAKVCEGVVRIYVNGQNSYCNGTAEAGDTNVVLQLRSYSSQGRQRARRASLTGRPLPDLGVLGTEAKALPAEGPLLLCLFDSEQRPSRRFLRSLAEQYQVLRQKKVHVLCGQANVVPDDAWQAWKTGNSLPFPLGRVTDKSAEAKWVTEVESLPWLILTDAQRKVLDEGFALDDLSSKLEMVGQ